MVLKKSENNSIEKAASIILSGGVVIMPCDTIYGMISLTGDAEKKKYMLQKVVMRENLLSDLLLRKMILQNIPTRK